MRDKSKINLVLALLSAYYLSPHYRRPVHAIVPLRHLQVPWRIQDEFLSMTSSPPQLKRGNRRRSIPETMLLFLPGSSLYVTLMVSSNFTISFSTTDGLSSPPSLFNAHNLEPCGGESTSKTSALA